MVPSPQGSGEARSGQLLVTILHCGTHQRFPEWGQRHNLYRLHQWDSGHSTPNYAPGGTQENSRPGGRGQAGDQAQAQVSILSNGDAPPSTEDVREGQGGGALGLEPSGPKVFRRQMHL